MKKFLSSRYTRIAAGFCAGIMLMFYITPVIINLVGLQTYEAITTGSGAVTSVLFIVMAFAIGAVIASMLRGQNEQRSPQPQQH